MKHLSCLLSVCLLLKRASAEGVVHSEVKALTDSDFDKVVAQDPLNGLWFLKFYAPWCGHCKKLTPVLDKVAPFMKGKMAFGKVDCTVEKKICERFGIKGYPTLKIYRDGDYFDYPQERDADSIINFGEIMAANSVKLASSVGAAYDDIAGGNANGVAFVAYDPNAKGEGVDDIKQSTKLLQVFAQVARKQQAYATFAVFAPDLVTDEVVKIGAGKEAFIAKIEDGVDSVVYQGEISSPDLLDFVKTNNRALVTALGSHNFRTVGTMGKSLAIGVVNPEDTAKTAALMSEIKTLAKSETFGSKFVFCWMDGKKWERFLTQFNIGSDNLPELFVLDFHTKEFWQDASIFEGKEFLEGVLSGDIPPQKQASKKGPLNDTLNLFRHFMPWSAIFMVLLFTTIFYLALPADEQATEEHVSGKKTEAKKDK
mmetsp:Transcript_54588/g.81039  ORF Transcript_54588/g.81039 Transcript_54588/m.81039 type:complete len:426 (-) Transcript_54588:470-1747(-)|eukprot:CAMPEP_0195527026 /NCGR_PEP_ID=MMETSP0794_2-20130614/28444_1 /TAXON_ID=515487 /ORGANISM="Stephanopyxis turris, Strain CCMP 815" /LENGTH=425 /DNA_ID=CAMNT_0040657849 /DNA_START=75 /DNA_END=1352 /DNA_ORIENTATION=-